MDSGTPPDQRTKVFPRVLCVLKSSIPRYLASLASLASPPFPPRNYLDYATFAPRNRLLINARSSNLQITCGVVWTTCTPPSEQHPAHSNAR